MLLKDRLTFSFFEEKTFKEVATFILHHPINEPHFVVCEGESMSIHIRSNSPGTWIKRANEEA